MVKELGSCWKCGTTEKLTKHHAIPKWLKPKVNMLIPLCGDCHKQVDLLSVRSQIDKAIRILRKVKNEK